MKSTILLPLVVLVPALLGRAQDGTTASGSSAPATATAASASSNVTPPHVDENYVIGPLDVLLVNVWKEPSFTGSYTVHTDGKFTMPLVGDLQAGGLTPVEIEPIVVQALSKLLVKPLVTVTVAVNVVVLPVPVDAALVLAFTVVVLGGCGVMLCHSLTRLLMLKLPSPTASL